MSKKNPESLTEAIMRIGTERFVVNREDPQTSELIELCPTSIEDKTVLRLQRKLSGTRGSRTLLVCELANSKEIDHALEWSAACKDFLLDPESADLYLFLVLREQDITVEQCINIEANDKFCRKFIQRPSESNEEMIDRTFLLSVADNSTNQSIQDPLTVALTLTSKDVDWFDKPVQNDWRAKLLSVKSGPELIELLFEDNNNKLE